MRSHRPENRSYFICTAAPARRRALSPRGDTRCALPRLSPRLAARRCWPGSRPEQPRPGRGSPGGCARHAGRPIRPALVHLHGALQGPPSTALLRAELQDRLLHGPADPAGVQPRPAVRRGHHGQGRDDRHRRLVRVAHGGARPGRLRQGLAPARAAEAHDHPARGQGPPVPGRTATARAGPARPTSMSSTRTRSLPARRFCWSRPRRRRTRAAPASRRSSKPRST